MGVPNVVYKWSSLRVLYVIVLVMNVAGFVIVVVMIVSAVRLKRGFGNYLNLVAPGDGHLWPALTTIAAVLCAPIYALGIRLCLRLKFYRPPSSDLSDLNHRLFLHSVLCFASVFLVAGMNAAVIVHSGTSFHHRINDGLAGAMRDYATETVSKIRVDMIQIKFHCCGSKTYKEWFSIPWLQVDDIEETEDRDTSSSGGFISADVPFSCCSTEMLKPCIHHNILRSSDVYIYEPEHRLTIATTGCQAKILAHANGLGNLLIGTLFLLSGYQILLSLLSRLLQTAHSNSLYFGPEKLRYLAWIFGRMPNKEVYDKLVYKNEAPTEQEDAAYFSSTYAEGTSAANTDTTFGTAQTASGGRKRADGRCKKVKIKLLRKICSKLTSKTETVDVEDPFSTLGEEEKLPPLNIPAPPPSPDSLRADESREKDMDSSSKVERESSEESPLLGGKSQSILSFKKRRESSSQKADKRFSRSSKEKIKELRESLQYIDHHQSPWKGGSPVFEELRADRSNDHSRSDLGKAEMRPQERMRDRGTYIPRDSRSSIRDGDPEPPPPRRPSRGRPRHGRLSPRNLEGLRPESRSSRGHRACLCRKESIDHDEMRIKKFCKDLSAEYNESPFSKQRKEYSENHCWHDRIEPRYQDVDDNRDIRAQICAKFNPADAYSRFRGSTQDTVMRRSNQVQVKRPSLSPVPERGPAVARWSQMHQLNVPFPSRPPMGPSQMWAQQQTSWGPYYPPPPSRYYPQYQLRTSYNNAYPYGAYPDPGQVWPLIGPNNVQRPRYPVRCPMPPNIGEPPRFCGL